MNNYPNECIIIGGGESIKEGINLELKRKLENKFVIATNYSYKHFLHTFMCFVDRDFYYPTQECLKNHCHPNIYEELKSLPLIIGINHNGIEEFKLPNTYLVKTAPQFSEITDYREGFYAKNMLTGILAISLATFFMNYNGVIYLLGFDWTKQGNTHYYSKEEINHRGVGWTNSYAAHNPDSIFIPFESLEEVQIYNVSLNSNINNFKKISYEYFFKQLSNTIYNQERLRTEIKQKLTKD